MYVGILKDQSVFNSGIFMREADSMQAARLRISYIIIIQRKLYILI